jgi:CubicO group peptidase (beta-lactamase class C family)
MLTRRLFLLAPLLVLPALAPAQSPADPQKLAAVKAGMQKFVDSNDIAGAVTVVGRKDGILATDTVGFRDLAAKEPMKQDTLFRIASMTKPITALAVMILVDEGKLSVEDDIARHIPEFAGQMLRDPETKELRKPARPVKVRDLLTHTSGLAGSYPKEMADVYAKRDRTLAETTAAVAKLPLTFEPGSKWQYCNPGIDTLGRLVEVLSGKSFEEFTKTRIFDPLGMTDTIYYPTPEQLKRLAVTYGKDKDGKLVAGPPALIGLPKEPKHPIPAGGLVSCAADLSKLYRMMLNKGELDGKRIISAKSHAEMTRNQTGAIDPAGFVPGMCFGFGWAVVKEPKGVTAMLSPGTYGHGGAFGTQGWIDPGQDLFVVLLIQRSNLGNGDASPMRQTLQELAVAAIKR